MEDVNMEANFLIVRKSKNGKERIVPFTDSLSKVLAQYIRYREKLPCIRGECFFIKPNGEDCRGSAIDYWWIKVLSIAKTEEGKDLYYTLPVLSTYVGHSKLSSTDRYVRMTADMYPDLLGKTESICSYIFPKLKS